MALWKIAIEVFVEKEFSFFIFENNKKHAIVLSVY